MKYISELDLRSSPLPTPLALDPRGGGVYIHSLARDQGGERRSRREAFVQRGRERRVRPALGASQRRRRREQVIMLPPVVRPRR